MTKINQLPNEIRDRQVLIIAPDIAYAPLLQQALNRSYEFHAKYLKWPKRDLSLDSAEQSLKRSMKAFSSQVPEDEKKYYIMGLDKSCLIGCIGIRFLHDLKSYSIGYWVNVDYAGKGHMTRSLNLVLPLLSDYPVMLFISQFNISSSRLAARLGFQLVERIVGDRDDLEHGVHDTLIYRNDRYVRA